MSLKDIELIKGLADRADRVAKRQKVKQLRATAQISVLMNMLTKVYGFTEQAAKDWLGNRELKCELCPRTEIIIDHEHWSGVPRGLLCGRCNSMLGFAKDKPETLESAASYLRKFEAARGSLLEQGFVRDDPRISELICPDLVSRLHKENAFGLNIKLNKFVTSHMKAEAHLNKLQQTYPMFKFAIAVDTSKGYNRYHIVIVDAEDPKCHDRS